MKRLSRYGFLLALLTVAAGAQQARKPVTVPHPRFRISGSVVNAIGGQPLSQVTVFIAVPETPNDTEQVTPGEDGRFWFENMRIDPAHHVAGLRINAWVSIGVLLAALAWFLWLGTHVSEQRRPSAVHSGDSTADR